MPERGIVAELDAFCTRHGCELRTWWNTPEEHRAMLVTAHHGATFTGRGMYLSDALRAALDKARAEMEAQGVKYA